MQCAEETWRKLHFLSAVANTINFIPHPHYSTCTVALYNTIQYNLLSFDIEANHFDFHNIAITENVK